MSSNKLIYTILSAAILLLSCGICHAQSQSVIKDSEFYNEINKAIKDGIEKHGGSTSTGRYHFVIALSTAHFSTDQQNALAMTKAAQSIMNTICVPGDKITCVAWEQDAWDFTEQIGIDTAQDLKTAASALPQGNMDGSKGGHDTYRSLTSILKAIADPESSMIIMMTNSHENRGASGSSEKAMGKDSEELKAELEKNNFSAPENTSFTFDPDRKQGGEVFFTFAYPEHLKSLNGNSNARKPFEKIVLSKIQEDATILPDITEPSQETGAAKTSTEGLPSQNQKDSGSAADASDKSKNNGFPLIPVIIAIMAVAAAFLLFKGKGAHTGNEKNKKDSKKIAFKLDSDEFEGEIAEGETFELTENEGSLEFRRKEESESSDSSEEKTPAILEISFDKDSNSFEFKLTGSSMSTDPDDLGELKDAGNGKYLIADGYSATCYISYRNEEKMLSIN